eukprot:Nitzschia sp. Nitz4//scaffold9_size221794//26611//27630//NITZ4_001320-RA/size221794-processed-gene-0.308-mRNA-1//-1//CDS//3329560923//7039//frame0
MADAQLKRKRALADALAGVAGSIVSLWTFYPVEVWKTNSQAGSSPEKQSLYQGFFVKSLHTASSSFCYFYLYSWIFSNWRQWTTKSNPSVTTRLLLSAVAAMLNTFFTLPLDVISSQQVASNGGSSSTSNTRDNATGTTAGFSNRSSQDATKAMETVWEQVGASSKTEFELEASLIEMENSSTKKAPESSPSKQCEWLDQLENLSEYWKGLAPSLLLCTNPSINYTVFDMTKNRILARAGRRGSHLSMSEAFFVGLVAKFVATVATYPLIRAKVMLMVTSEKSMLASIIRSYENGGIRGLYKGCDWQLLHTVLKSALMMMIRERITDTTHRLILGSQAD